MFPNKTFCAPIYLGPEQIRDRALEVLETLKDSKSRQWVDDSTIFLDKNGSFSLKMIDEGSFRVRTLKASQFMAKFFCSSKLKAEEEEEEEEQRLHHARRRLLVSLLAHTWLWGRPKVLDNNGNLVAFEDREVLAPEKVLEFLRDTRVHTTGCRCKSVRDFLDNLELVPLHKDTSKWNMIGVIACLKWDKSHNLHATGPWCSCRLEKEPSPPPYHEVCPVKN